MPNTVLLIDALQDEIRLMLGGSHVDVELDKKDLLLFRRRAIRQYQRYLPGQARAALTTASPSVQKYPIVHPGLNGITHVWFVDEAQVTGAVDPFDPDSYITMNGLGNGLTVGQLDQEYSYREMGRRVLSAEPEWHGQWEGSNYFLYLSIPQSTQPYRVSYRYTYHYDSDAEADTLRGPATIPDCDTDWIVRYAVAQAKMVLGRIRNKFGGIPNAEGGVDEMDGAALVEEGREEERELLEALRKRRRPLDPVIE